MTSPRSNESSPRGSYASNGPPEFDTENMNSEDIYDSLRRTTAEIQSYMSSSRDDLDGIYKDGQGRVDSDEVSADSGLMDSMPDIRVDSPDGKVKEYLEFQQSQSPPPPQQAQTNGKSASNGGHQPSVLPTAAQTPNAPEPTPSKANSSTSYNPTNYQNVNVSTICFSFRFIRLHQFIFIFFIVKLVKIHRFYDIICYYFVFLIGNF